MLFNVLKITERVVNKPEKPEFHGKVFFEIDAEPVDIYSSDKVKEFIFPASDAAIEAWRKRAQNPTACPAIDYRYTIVTGLPDFRTKNNAGTLSATIHNEMRVGVRYDTDGNPTEKPVDKAIRIITANHEFVKKAGAVNESGQSVSAPVEVTAQQMPPQQVVTAPPAV